MKLRCGPGQYFTPGRDRSPDLGALSLSGPAYHANLSDKVFLCIREHNWHKLDARSDGQNPSRAERGSQLNATAGLLDKMQCSMGTCYFPADERNNRDLIISCFVHVRFVNLCFTTSRASSIQHRWDCIFMTFPTWPHLQTDRVQSRSPAQVDALFFFPFK